ncbi:MAG: hypothetical protein GY816_12835 [Cytophagales bacterium]|nr:hypothetical protein [Cytophagales bacterium]
MIKGVPESDSDKAADRKKEDLDYVTKIGDVKPGEVVKVFRAGRKDEESPNPRPLIVTLNSPDLANRLHKYGNGNRVLLDKVFWWINPDLTTNERKRNFECRELKRALLQSGRTFPSATPISLHNF